MVIFMGNVSNHSLHISLTATIYFTNLAVYTFSIAEHKCVFFSGGSAELLLKEDGRGK